MHFEYEMALTLGTPEEIWTAFAKLKGGLAGKLPAPGSADRTLTYSNGVACWEGKDIPAEAPLPGLDQD